MSQMFEPGHYHGRVTGWAMIKAKTGTPQFALTFQPIGRFAPQNPDGELIPCPDLERTIFRTITEKTAGRLLSDLQTVFEYPHELFSPLDPESADAFDFSNREFTAVLTYEEYEGKQRERWNIAAGPGGVNGEPLSESELRKLDRLFGAGKPKPKRPERKRPAEASSAAESETQVATQPA